MMWNVNDDLSVAKLVLISNVWLLTDRQGRRFLIDTGDRTERLSLRLGLWRAGVREPGDLTAVLLTHWHRDHAGNAAWLRRRFHCPIVCHAADAPYLTGAQRAPRMADRPLPPIAGVACRLQDIHPALSPVDEVYRPGRWRWGFVVLPVPGHTAGSVMLYHASSRTLFSGDAVLSNVPPFGWWEHLRLAMAEFSNDVETCHARTRRHLTADRPIARLCPGHGPVVDRDVERKLVELARTPEGGNRLMDWLRNATGFAGGLLPGVA